MFRQVLNDVVATDWDPMPEIQPPTLEGLVKFLRACPGWDIRCLSTEYRGWDLYQISYGIRAAFRLPKKPTTQELEWLEHEKATASVWSDDGKDAVI
jgi:hypothetical protein